MMADVHLIHESMGTADQSWVKYLEAFARKYNMPLQPLPAFVPQQVVAGSRQRLLEVMTPDHWDE